MTTRSVGITGGAGFIGRHLEASLREKSHHVICFEGDITDPSEVRRLVGDCEVIFHLAGRNIGPEDEILRVNTEGTRLLAEAAAAKGDRHIVFSSSNLVIRRPESAYARSKLAGEEMLAGIAGSNGCRVSLFRIANVYGPGSRPFYNSVVATFCWYAAAGRSGELPIHGDGSQVVEFVPVEEVVEALSASLDQAEPLRRAGISGEAFSVRELGETVSDPKKRAAHPALEAQYQSYRSARLTGQKEVRSYPIHTRASGSFQELLHEDEASFGQLSVCTIAPFDERGGHFHIHKEEWFCVLQGRMALDFFTKAGEYVTTQLLEAEHPRFVHVPPPYYHVVRNIGPEEVKFLIVANEVFDPENPDTSVLPFRL
jgi:UDP-2-acetamido-2,6-beta-L-arabino-hexul-4-ose reductase